jgi:quercetin dioxygenase-like cupin family protein/MoaA/NifB/PqqE/SkfB family radical SAM enzyme
MSTEFFKKLRCFLLGPPKSAKKKKPLKPLSQVFRQELPLDADFETGWKRYPLFNRKVKNRYRISAHISVLVPGHCPHPPHIHDEEEILIMLAGEADLLLPEKGPDADSRLRVRAGDFVYYPAEYSHSLEAAGDTPATYLMFKWSGNPVNRKDSVGFRHFCNVVGIKEGLAAEKFSFIRLFEAPTVCLPKLQCHLSHLPPGKSYAAHSDPYDVAILVLEGEVETLGQRAGKNAVIFYAAGEPHGMANPGDITAKYLVFEFHHKFKPDHFKPIKVALEASSRCQLKCITCPTSRGDIAKHLGNGFLDPGLFRRFIDNHPYITEIELSNWGEALLNPDLPVTLRIAFENGVRTTLLNGANLNSASQEVLEALVKYRLRAMTVSIDGASQQSYSKYRIHGQYDQVIENIRTINRFKAQYGSPYPALHWQFIAFGHNEEEIGQARALAGELGMKFRPKLSWEDLYYEHYSPVKDRDKIRREMPEGCADRQEFEAKTGSLYIEECCTQIWTAPRINYDGRLIGCCINYREDFGNVFTDGLENCLRSDKMKATRELLMGLPASRQDIPCVTCKVYKDRSRLKRFVVI